MSICQLSDFSIRTIYLKSKTLDFDNLSLDETINLQAPDINLLLNKN